ncbi:hypothetical protein D3C85_570930 [compost metagenome]
MTVDIQSFLDNNGTAATDSVVPVESQVDALFGVNGDETISQEGFTEVLKRFWTWLSEPGKPGVSAMAGGWSARRDVIVKALEKTYLNPEWLARRTVREGTVLKLDGSYDYIGIDGVINTTDLAAPIADFLEKQRKIAEVYSQYLRLIDLELQRIMRKTNTQGADNLNYFELEAISEALEQSQVRLTVDFRTTFGNTHVQRILTPALDSDKPFNAAKLKDYKRAALSATEVMTSAQGIIEVSKALDIMAELRVDFANMKGFQVVKSYIGELEDYMERAEEYNTGPDAASQNPIDTDVHERMFDLMKNVYSIPNRMIAFHLRHVDSIIRAYARLIDASVK